MSDESHNDKAASEVEGTANAQGSSGRAAPEPPALSIRTSLYDTPNAEEGTPEYLISQARRYAECYANAVVRNIELCVARALDNQSEDLGVPEKRMGWIEGMCQANIEQPHPLFEWPARWMKSEGGTIQLRQLRLSSRRLLSETNYSLTLASSLKARTFDSWSVPLNTPDDKKETVATATM